MSLVLWESTRRSAQCVWTERLEVLAFGGIYQLAVQMIAAPGLDPVEVWISRDCRTPAELLVEAAVWAERTGADAGVLASVRRRCSEALAAWAAATLEQPRRAETVRAS